MPEIVMPRLSDSMEEGTILTWLKKVGEEVAVGEELVEIETDKANMAYESDTAGTLTEILAEEGETLAIGTPIARIGEPGESSDSSAEGSSGSTAGPVTGQDSSSSQAAGEEPSPAPPADGAAGETAEGSEGSERVKASPVARRLAEERGVELASLQGSGPGGRIVKKDVEGAVPSAGPVTEDDSPARPRGSSPSAPPADGTAAPDGGAAAPPAGEAAPPAAEAVAPDGEAPGVAQSGVRERPEFGGAETAKGQVARRELTKLQATVARRMAESKATAPHFYLEAEVDMSRAVEARARIKAASREGDVVPSFNDMVVKACALALREFPRANGAYRDGGFELYSRVNVGVAVAGQDALVVPTVFDADRKGLRQIASEARALAAKVREGTITPPELSGGTFTVSNLGMYGIDAFAAVINVPQAAILAVGAIKERPAVRGGEIVPAHLMNLTLACDHRILYGADGAEFLARVRELLEEPVSLAL